MGLGGVACPKPSRLDREMRKHARKKDRQLRKMRQLRKQAAELTALRREVFRRDHGRCRVTGMRLKLFSDDPQQIAHAHHVIFKSAGGPNELHNMALVCPAAHERIHAHQYDVTGNANFTLTCLERDLETGKVLRSWESPNPSAQAPQEPV